MQQQLMNQKILIADDHSFTRLGLRRFLESEGLHVFDAADAQAARGFIDTGIDAAVLDIELPEKPGDIVRYSSNTGLILARYIKEKYPKTGVVLLSSHPDRGRYFWNLVSQGHRGLAYILKNGDPENLLSAIRQTQAGRIFCDELVTNTNEFAGEIINQLSEDECEWILYAVKELPNLTSREQEVASALLDSYDIRGIASQMGIKENAVSNHITNIYEKLGLSQVPNNLSARTLLVKAQLIFDFQQGSV